MRVDAETAYETTARQSQVQQLKTVRVCTRHLRTDLKTSKSSELKEHWPKDVLTSHRNLQLLLLVSSKEMVSTLKSHIAVFVFVSADHRRQKVWRSERFVLGVTRTHSKHDSHSFFGPLLTILRSSIKGFEDREARAWLHGTCMQRTTQIPKGSKNKLGTGQVVHCDLALAQQGCYTVFFMHQRSWYSGCLRFTNGELSGAWLQVCGARTKHKIRDPQTYSGYDDPGIWICEMYCRADDEIGRVKRHRVEK